MVGRNLLWLVVAAIVAYVSFGMNKTAVRSIMMQSLNYFSRPNSGEIRMTPIEGRAAWKGIDLKPEDWMVTLTPDEVDGIDREVKRLESSGVSMDALSKNELHFDPAFATIVEGWKDVLNPRNHDGLGFLVIRGLPTERWTVGQSELFFWALGRMLGIPGAQSGRGELLGHVRDEFYGHERKTLEELKTRQYRTNENILFHCDAADVVGLMCLQPAKQGGTSRIASSVTIYNELLKTRPDLIPHLYEDFYLDTRGDGDTRYFKIRPVSYYDGDLKTFWHSGYYTSVWEYDFMPEPDPKIMEVIQEYDRLANDPSIQLTMDFQPGDIQLLSNHYIVHARSGYEDSEDPALRRHLLRLWLSLENREKGAKETVLKAVDSVKILSKLIGVRVSTAAAKYGITAGESTRVS
eukprot:Clim_evm5s151 gene=Clim_evmTU5s151